MKVFHPWLALPLVCLGVMPVAAAGADTVTLAERDAIIQQVTQATAAELKLPATQLRLAAEPPRRAGDWVFVTGRLKNAAGQRIDYAGTALQDAAQAGGVSDLCAALLQREGSGWKVIELAVGPTDLVWSDWAQRHAAPKGLIQ